MSNRPYFEKNADEIRSLFESSGEDQETLTALYKELCLRKSRKAKKLKEEIGKCIAALPTKKVTKPSPKRAQSKRTAKVTVGKSVKGGDGTTPRKPSVKKVVANATYAKNDKSTDTKSVVEPISQRHESGSSPGSVGPRVIIQANNKQDIYSWSDFVFVLPDVDLSALHISPWFLGRWFGSPKTLLSFHRTEISVQHQGLNTSFLVEGLQAPRIVKGWLSDSLEMVFGKQDPKEHSWRGLAFDSSSDARKRIVEGQFFERINLAVNEFNILIQTNGYVTTHQIENWGSRHSTAINEVTQFVQLDGFESSFISSFLELVATWRNRIACRNDNYVALKKDEYREFFNKLESNPLTEKQVEAILRDDDHTLVVAGAGTGKTSTVVGKIGFLVESGEVSESDIIALAYNKDAAQEMRERVAERTGLDVEIKTFHSLGKKILEEGVGEKKYVTDTASNDKALHALLARLVTELVEDVSTRHLVIDFVVYHRYPAKYLEDFDREGDYFKYLRKQEPHTLRGEPVKSFEELLIADWLLLNGINYEYEAPYEHKTAERQKRQYKPDFYLVDYGIYIEHFGIAKDGSTAPGINREKYHQGMRWKQDKHQEFGTTLIETYSWERMNQTLLPSLEEKLREHGVVIRPMDSQAISRLIQQREVNEPLVDLLGRFLSIYQEGMWSEDEVWRRASDLDDFESNRAKVFLSLFFALEKSYSDRLSSRQEIDFSDMIKGAVGLLQNGQVKVPCRRIIVDEYQDISRGRHQFLRELLKQSEDTRILCVGDDWQSIYGFNGSDIRMTTEFESHFGSCTRVDLDRTFRFGQPQLDVTSWFVQKNKSQLVKNIFGREEEVAKQIEIVFLSAKEDEYTENILEVIEESRPEGRRWSVLLLGRYKRLEPADLEQVASGFPELDVSFMTIHKSKGLEADAVVILDLKAARYGFPSEVENDSLINLILPANDEFVHAEERRVFYVAATRARSKTLIVADPSSPSDFIKELFEHPNVYGPREEVFDKCGCPMCEEGQLQLTNPKRVNGYAWRCSLRPFCKGEAKFCQKCMKAPAVEISGRQKCLSPNCS